jgi:hypothetical protein
METETYTVEYRDLHVGERVQFDTDNLSDAWMTLNTVDRGHPYLELVYSSPNMRWDN